MHNRSINYFAGKVYVPAGTEIIISEFNMQRNKKIWGEDAETFNPDHFLPERQEKPHPYSFIPFSAGSRNCIGDFQLNVQSIGRKLIFIFAFQAKSMRKLL